MVALAPALGDTGGSRFLLALLPVLSRLVPTMPIDPKLDLSRLTRDPKFQHAYMADPLYQTRVTPRIAAELLRAVADTRERAAASACRCSFCTARPTRSPRRRAAVDFYERAGSATRPIKPYEGAYHNLFVETNREEIYDDIAAWIGART